MSIVTGQPQSTIHFDLNGHDDFSLREMYRRLLLPRMIEEKMLLLLRQGRISKWFSGIGQEAISVGATSALRETDWILPLHRNLGVFTTRNFPLNKLFAQWQGKSDGYTKGRDRSFHFGAPEHRVIGMISHIGSMLGVADGISLAGKLLHDNSITLAFIGDGGTSQGDFHEAVNLAACWDLPVIFMIENNGYALSTPVHEQYRCSQLADKAIGYGIEGITIDGNNVLEVHKIVSRTAKEVRETGRPVIIEAMTFRRRGHEEASGVAYIPKELIEEWERKDPVSTFEHWLIARRVLSDEEMRITREVHAEAIEAGVEHMINAPEPTPVIETELAEVHAPSPAVWNALPHEAGPEFRLVDALVQGLRQGMEHDPSLVFMGQDVAHYGGVFKVTEGLADRFGFDRVRNTPLCEAAVIGAALGLSIRGIPSVVEMQFADFASEGFNQIANNLAKTHYRWGTSINTTIRMPTGGGVAAGPFHSQSIEAWFTHIPGLKVVFPSTPYDAKGLLTSALREPNPVMFFEHKYLYRSRRGPVPEEYYTIPLGQARIAREGSGASIITWGIGVVWGLEVAEVLPEYDLEVIDLRTLIPWDRESVFASVRKTGRALIVHEATLAGGFGGEIGAVIGEHLFDQLDAPVMRCGSLDTPVPFNKGLEDQFMAKNRLHEIVEKLMRY